MATHDVSRILGNPQEMESCGRKFKIAPVSSFVDVAAFEDWLKRRWLAQHRSVPVTSDNPYRDNELTMRILQQKIDVQEAFDRLNTAEGFEWLLRHSLKKGGHDDEFIDELLMVLPLREQADITQRILVLSGIDDDPKQEEGEEDTDK